MAAGLSGFLTALGTNLVGSIVASTHSVGRFSARAMCDRPPYFTSRRPWS